MNVRCVLALVALALGSASAVESPDPAKDAAPRVFVAQTTGAPPPMAVPAEAAPQPTHPPPPARRRGSWYIGFGLGGGSGDVVVGGQRYGMGELLGGDTTSGSLNLRVGATVGETLLVGFDGGALAVTAGSNERIQLNRYDVGAMWFPWSRGPYLRAAVGPSTFVVQSDGPVLSGEGTLSAMNALAGVGYAWWLGKAFNLTFNLDYQQHRRTGSGADGITRASGFSAWVGFDWY